MSLENFYHTISSTTLKKNSSTKFSPTITANNERTCIFFGGEKEGSQTPAGLHIFIEDHWAYDCYKLLMNKWCREQITHTSWGINKYFTQTQWNQNKNESKRKNKNNNSKTMQQAKMFIIATSSSFDYNVYKQLKEKSATI